MPPLPAGRKGSARPAARDSFYWYRVQSEPGQHAARVAEVADDIRGRRGRHLGEGGRDHDAIGQRAPRVFADVYDLQLVAVFQVSPANRLQIGDGLDRE